MAGFMPSTIMRAAALATAGGRRVALASGAAAGLPDKHPLAIATLVSWLIAEAFGAYMLTSWIGGGGHKASGGGGPDVVPRPVIFGHAALAFTGLVLWICFVVTGVVALAWVSVAVLAPAIGLGISTVTLWTPYPARRPAAEPNQVLTGTLGITSDEMLARALEDEALTAKLVDDLVASVLAKPPPALRRPRLEFAPLIPAVHGLLALSTVALAVLCAVVSS
jgi:hypothetical protein